MCVQRRVPHLFDMQACPFQYAKCQLESIIWDIKLVSEISKPNRRLSLAGDVQPVGSVRKRSDSNGRRRARVSRAAPPRITPSGTLRVALARTRRGQTPPPRLGATAVAHPPSARRGAAASPLALPGRVSLRKRLTAAGGAGGRRWA